MTLGLTAAIEWQTQDFQNRTGIQCEFNSTLLEVDLDRDRSTAVFRILQETLTNVARHASATKVNIYLGKKDRKHRIDCGGQWEGDHEKVRFSIRNPLDFLE